MTDSILTAVQQHPFSQGLTPEHCATLASLGTRATYGKDEIIFAEGDQRHEFFLLLKGRVALEMMAQGKALRVHTLEAGDELDVAVLGDEFMGNVAALDVELPGPQGATVADYAEGIEIGRAHV